MLSKKKIKIKTKNNRKKINLPKRKHKPRKMSRFLWSDASL